PSDFCSSQFCFRMSLALANRSASPDLPDQNDSSAFFNSRFAPMRGNPRLCVRTLIVESRLRSLAAFARGVEDAARFWSGRAPLDPDVARCRGMFHPAWLDAAPIHVHGGFLHLGSGQGAKIVSGFEAL